MRSKLASMGLVLLVSALILSGCGPTPTPEVTEKVVKETVVVEQEKIITKIVPGPPVKETVVVEKPVTSIVVKEVTRVIKEVVTATPLPAPTATAIPPTATPVPLSELGQIAFVSVLEYREGHPEIYVMDADGSNARRLSKDGTLIVGYNPAWSPDGRYIAFGRAGDIYVVDADGSNPRNLTKYRAGDGEPAWSPDGRYIAFWSNREERRHGMAYAEDIFVMEADGSNPRNLTDNKVSDTSPAWSPDGRYIVFQSDRDENQEIYVMDADGSNPRRLTNNKANDLWPAWSPDGRYIAFVSHRDGNHEIYVMDADGSNPRRLTDNEGFDGGPAWSPDGHYIAFQSEREGESQEVYVMEADGSNPRCLTDIRGIQPSWGPSHRAEVSRQPVDGWVGTIVKFPSGFQFDDYFEREDEQRYGIEAMGADAAVRQQMEEYRWTGAQVQVWGQALTGIPEVEGRQIQVERIEALSGPAGEARNLSPFATPSASSVLPADRGGTYHPWSAVDGLLNSCWTEGASDSGVGEWIMLTFPGAIEVHRIGLDVGFDRDAKLFAANNRLKRATIGFSTGESVELEFSDSRGMQVRDITPVETTFVRVIIDEVYAGSKYDDTCLAEIEVWGRTK